MMCYLLLKKAGVFLSVPHLHCQPGEHSVSLQPLYDSAGGFVGNKLTICHKQLGDGILQSSINSSRDASSDCQMCWDHIQNILMEQQRFQYINFFFFCEFKKRYRASVDFDCISVLRSR